MPRDIVRTELEEEKYLRELFTRLERDADSSTEISYTGTEAEKIVRYRFEQILDEGGVF